MEKEIETIKRILLGIVEEHDIQKFLNNQLTDQDFLNINNFPIPEYLIEGLKMNTFMYSMIGYKRMTNIKIIIDDIMHNNIDGHFIETGVWKGGATMFMKYILNEYNSNKKVFVADSFNGVPPPNPEKYPVDKDDPHHTFTHLNVSLYDVVNNFKKFNLLDGNVIFIEGWFKDTLPQLNENFSLLRLDGDIYESTMDALINLYSKLSIGGYIIIDDYGAINQCKQAVLDFRKSNNITEEFYFIDYTGIYWKKEI